MKEDLAIAKNTILELQDTNSQVESDKGAELSVAKIQLEVGI